MTKTVLVPIAQSSEEMEAIIIVDCLRRAGVTVTLATVHEYSLEITASRGVKIIADAFIKDVDQESFDAIILPGGMPGATHLSNCQILIDLLKKQKESGKLYGAICAAPAVVLAKHGLLDGKQSFTCYPNPTHSDLLGAGYQNKSVVVDGNLITSQGPGTTFDFALTIIHQLLGQEKRDEICKSLIYSSPSCCQ
ncbi:DJ-1/ThiJ/PfpI family protein [Cavenderia fasciculata]|uniref:DJ-1/ThiJ/PfpI family protein n=1 Tax=Cavenderia fasciculata TaxID=261658 RepID=F4PU16_CACFS|nr:DJ-1/ThiJ/PfpI family protein [Cavenderia fasciculata]EGG21784.1 DJ-1/ThiJ/PfpI family protein [Cavenderia fasciculata]|eukprot:XP_004359634.1 DJ-1/ThiJ/PfpI family protein [Cavenderia fasciculata]